MREETNLGKRIGQYIIDRYIGSDEAEVFRFYEATCTACDGDVVIRIAINGQWRTMKSCKHRHRKESFEQRKALLFACI